jgi:hypothetical protein
LLQKVMQVKWIFCTRVDKHHIGSRTPPPPHSHHHHRIHNTRAPPTPWPLPGAPGADQEEVEGCQAKKNKAARQEEQGWQEGGAELPEALDQRKREGTRSRPDTNSPTSKNFSNKVNKPRTSSSFCSYHLQKKIRGAAVGYSQIGIEVLCLVPHRVVNTKSNKKSICSYPINRSLRLCIIG